MKHRDYWRAIIFIALLFNAFISLCAAAETPSADDTQSPAAALSNYRLSTGDVIKIQVFDEPQLDVQARLTDAGTVSYPLLGELNLKGMSIGEIERMITEALEGDYLIHPQVTVTVLEYRQFFVNGEVKSPGGYTFFPGLTLIKAVSLAGGFTDYAAKEKIEIARDINGKEKIFRATQDALIMPGDILTVKQSFF